MTVFVFFLCVCALQVYDSSPALLPNSSFLFVWPTSFLYVFLGSFTMLICLEMFLFYSFCWNTENVLILQALLNLSRNLDKKPGWAISCSFTSSYVVVDKGC